MATCSGRLDALQIASDWIGRALFPMFWVAGQLRQVLIYQASLFLLMGYDTTELRVWRDEHDNIEVVPLRIVNDRE